ncbi:MAG: hypothetical protein AAB372_04465 [Patescibacteria group bacterium]
MAQTQFITHIPVAPPPSVTSRRGSGVFAAVVLVIVILVGVATAGLEVFRRQLEEEAGNIDAELNQLESDLELSSIEQAQKLQQRIQLAEKILNDHVYGSQSFNIVEDNTLDSTTLKNFAFLEGGKIKLQVETSGYVPMAQQVRQYRANKDIAALTFTNPLLQATGGISFDIEMTVSPEFLRTKPSSRSAIVAPPVSTITATSSALTSTSTRSVL